MSTFMLYSLLTISTAISLLSRGASAGTPISCGGLHVCARYIRPYSENAYEWGTICGLNQPADSLIADNLEMYDYQEGWCAP